MIVFTCGKQKVRVCHGPVLEKEAEFVKHLFNSVRVKVHVLRGEQKKKTNHFSPLTHTVTYRIKVKEDVLLITGKRFHNTVQCQSIPN